jgi:NAD(P)-dependent dehydrogenase (short-subunit alcohol dehydrogenase family)
MRLDGLVAVVTGGGSGIGRMSSHVLASAGADVVVLDLDTEAAELTAHEIGCAHRSVDITDEAAVVEVFSELDRCDVLVAAAGLSLRKPTFETSLSAWQAVVDVNLNGVFLSAREAGRHMVNAGRGSIIAITSVMGYVGGAMFPNPAYHASKGGVVNLVRALAVEWAPENVRVNALAPTFVETPFIEGLLENPDLVSGIEKLTPLGRLATVNDLAAGLLYLASPGSAMVTGQSLVIDGGWLAQ